MVKFGRYEYDVLLVQGYAAIAGNSWHCRSRLRARTTTPMAATPTAMARARASRAVGQRSVSRRAVRDGWPTPSSGTADPARTTTLAGTTSGRGRELQQRCDAGSCDAAAPAPRTACTVTTPACGCRYGQVSDNGEYGLWWNGVDASVPLVVSDTTFSGNGTAAGWLHFRDAAGTVTFERNAATAPKNGFRADGRLNQGSLTWNNGDDLPLLISGGLTIAPATTLALEPGTVVKFGERLGCPVVQGMLDAQGTAGAPLALTSVSDDAHGGDTNGDGTSQGQPGQWAGLRFAAGSTRTAGVRLHRLRGIGRVRLCRPIRQGDGGELQQRCDVRPLHAPRQRDRRAVRGERNGCVHQRHRQRQRSRTV